jgi:septal ring-binding cell division protein DamX
MDITIKTIRGVAVTSLITMGLVACSSSPAPWTQADESPWGAKHEAETPAIPSNEALVDTSLNDPVLLADPEPVILQETEIVSEAEVIAPVVVEDLTVEEELMAMPATNYAVQVYAGKTAESVEKFKSSKNLNDLKTVRTERSGSIVYVLVDIYPDRITANAAAADLEVITGSKPWVRPLAGLQKIVSQ